MRKILWIVLCVCLGLGIIPVSAEGENYTLTRKEILDEVTDGTHSGFIIRTEVDGKVAYCVNPFVEIQYGEGYAPSLDTLSAEVKERIFQHAYYGYNYQDHTDKKWYVATQLLIWKEISEEAAQFHLTYDYTNVEAETNEILRLEGEDRTPSFNGETKTVKVGDEVVFEDTTGYLSEYPVPTGNGYEARYEENQLIVKITEETFDTNIKSFYGGSETKGTVYEKENSQPVFTVEGSPTHSYTVHLEEEKGSLSIIKKDENGITLGTGHVFQISRDENFTDVVGEYETNENGVVSITNGLTKGTYFIKEVQTIDPYQLNTNVQTVEIKSGVLSVIECINSISPAEVIIVKVDEEENRINDTKFRVTREDEVVFEGSTGHSYIQIVDNKKGPLSNYEITLYKEEEEIGVFTTNDFGLIENDVFIDQEMYYYDIDGNRIYILYNAPEEGVLRIENLNKQDRIEIQEIEAAKGYIKEDTPIELTLNEDRTYVNVVNKKEIILEPTPTVEPDEIVPTNMEIFKVDIDTREKLTGSIFGVTNIDTGEELGNFVTGYFYLRPTDVNGNIEKGAMYDICKDEMFRVSLGSYQTDGQGEIVIPLSEGNYYARKSDHTDNTVYTVRVMNGGFEIKDVPHGNRLEVCEKEPPAGYAIDPVCQVYTSDGTVLKPSEQFEFGDPKIVQSVPVPVMREIRED